MYGGAALSLVGVFVNLTTLGTIKRRLPVTSPALLASTEHEAIAEFIVGGLVVAAVWIFLATVAVWIAGLAATLLLWQRGANTYFRPARS
jgi:hypothetical protein